MSVQYKPLWRQLLKNSVIDYFNMNIGLISILKRSHKLVSKSDNYFKFNFGLSEFELKIEGSKNTATLFIFRGIDSLNYSYNGTIDEIVDVLEKEILNLNL